VASPRYSPWPPGKNQQARVRKHARSLDRVLGRGAVPIAHDDECRLSVGRPASRTRAAKEQRVCNARAGGPPQTGAVIESTKMIGCNNNRI